MIFEIAHGLVGRRDLPLPEVFFGWAAAIVLIVSFVGLAVLWPKPKLEQAGFRPLPRLSAVLSSRPAEIACGAIGVFLLGLSVYAGFSGVQTATANFAPKFVYVTFWIGLVGLSVVFGDVFRAFNPVAGLRTGRRLGRADGRARADPGAAPLPRSGSATGRRRPASSPSRWLELIVSPSDPRPSRPRDAGARLLGRSPSSGWRSTGSRRGASAARPSPSTSGCSRELSVWGRRDGVARPAPAARGPRQLQGRRRHGAVARGDDRHRHLRRHPGGLAVAERLPRTWSTSSSRSGSGPQSRDQRLHVLRDAGRWCC